MPFPVVKRLKSEQLEWMRAAVAGGMTPWRAGKRFGWPASKVRRLMGLNEPCAACGRHTRSRFGVHVACSRCVVCERQVAYTNSGGPARRCAKCVQAGSILRRVAEMLDAEFPVNAEAVSGRLGVTPHHANTLLARAAWAGLARRLRVGEYVRNA